MPDNLDGLNSEFFKAKLKVLVTIFAAIILGQLIFLAVVVSLGDEVSSDFADEEASIFLTAAVAAVALAGIVCTVLRFFLVQCLGAEQDPTRAWGRYQLITIIALAVGEGAAFICLVFAMIGVDPALMFTLFGLSLFCQFLHFPSLGRFRHALERACEMQRLRNKG